MRGQSQQKRTLFANTSVICWEDGEHIWIVALSILAIIFFPVAFLGVTFWISFSYAVLPQRTTSDSLLQLGSYQREFTRIVCCSALAGIARAS